MRFKYAVLLVFLLLVLELSFRAVGFGDPPLAVRHPSIEYHLKPSKEYSRFGHRIFVNSMAMRSREPIPGFKYKNRINLFGDSVVYGNHFLTQEETIAEQLNSQLDEHVGDANLVSALAASSWGPENILRFYREFDPGPGDVAVIILSSHDRYDVPFTSRSVVPYRTHPSMTALGDFVTSAIERLRPRIGLRDDELSRDELVGKSTMPVEYALEELIDRVKSRHRVTYLLHHPTVDELRASERIVPNTEYYRDIALSSGVIFKSGQDILAPLLAVNGEGGYRDNIHLNAAGSKALAQGLYHLIQEDLNGLVPSSNQVVRGEASSEL